MNPTYLVVVGHPYEGADPIIITDDWLLAHAYGRQALIAQWYSGLHHTEIAVHKDGHQGLCWMYNSQWPNNSDYDPDMYYLVCPVTLNKPLPSLWLDSGEENYVHHED